MRLVRATEERYGFLQGPRVVSDYNLQNGITFLDGQFGTTLITKLSVHGNGVLAEANDTTDQIDAFLDDLISFSNELLGFTVFTEPDLRRAYLSQFEAEIENGLAESFSEFTEIGRKISSIVKSYGANSSPFEVTELALHCDINALELPRPGPKFSIARRAAETFDKRLYFVSAPLRTKEHISLVNELEKMFAARAASAPKTNVSSQRAAQSRADAPESSSPPVPSRPSRPARRRRS
jgi:hypothetical protein